MHTRLTPKQRCEQLYELIKNIRETPDALKQIKNWGLELDDELTKVKFIYKKKKIFFFNQIKFDKTKNSCKAVCCRMRK